MDHSTLVFIILIEAIIIAYMVSKLRQYQKFDRLFKETAMDSRSDSGAEASEQTSRTVTESTALGADQSAHSGAAQAASRAVSGSISAEADEDLLDIPGVDPENNIEEAKRVQLVMARCRYAEFYIEQLDDDYERGQFERIIKSCKSTARNIADPFFRASAMQTIIMLLHRAEWESERDQLLAEVDDELVRQGIMDEIASESAA